MVLLRGISRVVGALLMVALALLGLGLALYCLDALVSLGSVRPDRLLHLPTVRRDVGNWLHQVAAPGVTAGLALACGLGAMLIGVLLLIGTLRSPRQRLAILDTGDDGTLAARPRVLRTVAAVLAARADGVTRVRRPRVSLSRRGTRGRLRVVAYRTSSSDAQSVGREIDEELTPVSEPFHLRPRVRLQVAERGDRVQ